MRTERRHCGKCGCETLHDRVSSIWGDREHTGGVERGIMAVLSVGLSEALARRVHACQVCGRETRR